MGSRLDLQTLLETILGSDKVYFQPPATVQMVYPCIVYSRSKMNTKFANNNPYSLRTAYQVTLIDRNPDSVTVTKLASLPTALFDRHYTADNLNHDVFNIYY